MQKELHGGIVIFTKENCPLCEKAIEFMIDSDISYVECKLDIDYTLEELRKLMPEDMPEDMTITLPQIFIFPKLIGGYEEFVERHQTIGFGKG